MADEKITQLDALTTPAIADLLAIVDDVAGTPITKKIVLSDLLKVVDLLTAITTGYAGTDTLLTLDGGVAKYTTIANLLAGIEDALTELAATPASADTFLIIDGGVAKYLSLENLMKSINVRIAETVLAAADIVSVYDASGNHAAKITYPNFMATIEDALAELTTQPAQSDTLMVIDGGVAKYIQKRNLQVRYLQARLIAVDADVVVEDQIGSWFLHIPPDLDGLDLVYCHAENDTAGSGGTKLTLQIRNIDNALDMLSTSLTIDLSEVGSDTAAVAYAINTSNDHINTNDKIRIDCDVTPTTEPLGLTITLGFA